MHTIESLSLQPMFFAEPGQTLTLPLTRIERNMAFLDAMGVAIPISLRELTADDKVGDELTVFIWTDRSTELRATRMMPTVRIGEIAFLQVIDVAGGNGFVDIGLDEDVMLYRNHQIEPIEKGKRYYMTLIFDPVEQRLVMSTKIKGLFKSNPPYKFGDEVHFYVLEKAERGRTVLVDMKYLGYLAMDDAMPGIRRGDRYTGFVQQNDRSGFILTMYKQGREKVDEAMVQIMEMLHQNRGYLRLSDNTPPDEIKLRLRMSKKTFKQAIGQLYRSQKIDITPRGIKLRSET